MSNERVVVVGSGIAGMVAAYFEAKKGNFVTLVESDKRVGGLLKSDFSNNRYFDYGTHIFSETGVRELDAFLFGGFNTSNCMIKTKINTANYFRKNMNSKNCYVDISILPNKDYLTACNELLTADDVDSDNLESFFINRFGENIYRNIFEPVAKKYLGCDLSILSERSGYFFDMSRVLAFDDKTTKRLNSLEPYKKKLGHHVRNNGSKKFYPAQGGAGGLINLLADKLKEVGVEIQLSVNLKSIAQNNGNITSLALERELPVDKLIWTLPSGYLTSLCGLKQATSPPEYRNTGLYDFSFDRPLKSEATFINVYDVDLLSGRVTLYQNLSQNENYSCTVEVLTGKDVELEGLTDVIKLELEEMGLISQGSRCLFKQCRPIRNGFPVLTNDFVKEQSKLYEYCEQHFKNVLFIGRSSGKVFFMNDVLVDTYNKVINS